VLLGVLDCGQALLKSADVGRIVREGVIGKASSAGEILREKFGDCFLREAKVGEAFAIRFAFRKVGSRRFGLEPRKLRSRLCGMGFPIDIL
jgi:hypothetical protein